MALSLAVTLLWLMGGHQPSENLASAFLIATPGLWILIVGLVLLILLNALFTAAETAIDMLTALHVKHAATERQTRALQSLNEKQQIYVAACSVGSKFVRIVLVLDCLLIAEWVAVGIYGPLPTYGNILQAAAIVGLPVLFINLLLGELVPQSFASLHPAGVASALMPIIRSAGLLFSLPADLVVGLAGLITRRFGGRASFAFANQAEEQIKSLVETAEETGEIESDEREMLHSVFEFTDTIAREVMTPRVDLDAAPVDASAEFVAAIIEESGHSRIPLYEGSDDNIVGIILAKDLLLAMVKGKDVSLRTLLRPVIHIPEQTKIQTALSEMRLNRTQMAVVQDEYGGTAGVVTTEDIVEELVGDIVDEYDEEEPAVVKTITGIVVDGKTHMDDVNDELGSNLESEEFDTIGGFVFGLFGHQPEEEEMIEFGGYNFKVIETDGRRIQKVEVEPRPKEETDTRI
jgi:putative hemolysin